MTLCRDLDFSCSPEEEELYKSVPPPLVGTLWSMDYSIDLLGLEGDFKEFKGPIFMIQDVEQINAIDVVYVVTIWSCDVGVGFILDYDWKYGVYVGNLKQIDVLG